MDREIKTAAVITLGCKTNRYESIAITEQFERFGLKAVPETERADLYVINSCSVTSKTDSATRRIIRRLKRNHPDCAIAVTGCYAQLKADELSSMDEVDYVFSNTFKAEIVGSILQSDGKSAFTEDIFNEKQFLKLDVTDFSGRNRAFLKIQDGCDSYCSYCIVPYARGHNRSLPVTDVIGSVNRYVSAGFKEVVLSGIHIGKYGSDLSVKTDLVSLIREVEKSTDLARLRLSSIEPNEIDDSFIDLFTTSKILCSHLHIPLQSGDDDILKLMNRAYGADEFVILIAKLKSGISDMIIGADLIVGFPGETDIRFENTYNLIENADIDYLHVFPYSKRDGTKAYDMPGHIDLRIKKERAKKLRTLGEAKRGLAYRNATGKSVKVLFEKKAKDETGMLHGLTRNYLNAALRSFDEAMLNNEYDFIVNEIGSINNRPFIIL